MTTAYSYDGDGRRVKKVVGTGPSAVTTVFVYNVSGQLIAEYTDPSQPAQGSGGTSYLTSDHLGSTRFVPDATGGVKARHDYLPFGDELPSGIGGRTSGMKYDAADSTKQRFTQKERDAESGLDYFLARYYSAAQGRFTSPDEFTGGPDDLFFAALASANPTFYGDVARPQSLNKYQYGYNNPLRYVDPDGHDAEADPDPDPQQDSKSGSRTVPAPPLTMSRKDAEQMAKDAKEALDAVAELTEPVASKIRQVWPFKQIREWLNPTPPAQPSTGQQDTGSQSQTQPQVQTQTGTPPQQQAQPMPPPPPTEARGHRKRKRKSTEDKHTKRRPGDRKPPGFKRRVPPRPQDMPPKPPKPPKNRADDIK